MKFWLLFGAVAVLLSTASYGQNPEDLGDDKPVYSQTYLKKLLKRKLNISYRLLAATDDDCINTSYYEECEFAFILDKKGKRYSLPIKTIQSRCENHPDYCESIIENELLGLGLMRPYYKRVRVSNFRELVRAIRPNRNLILTADISIHDVRYPLGEQSPFVIAQGPKRTPNKVLTFHIKDVRHLKITGAAHPRGRRTLLGHRNISANILFFKNVHNVSLRNVKVLHTQGGSSCYGVVTEFADSSHINIESSTFAGSGMIGLVFQNTVNSRVSRVLFTDNSVEAVSISASHNIKFQRVKIHKNEASLALVSIHMSSGILFENSSITNNGVKSEFGIGPVFKIERSHNIRLRNISARNNFHKPYRLNK